MLFFFFICTSELIGSGKHSGPRKVDLVSEQEDTEEDLDYSESFVSDVEIRTASSSVSGRSRDRRARLRQRRRSQGLDSYK